MALRGVRDAPYEAASAVAQYALIAWAAIRGRGLREGVDLYALRCSDLLDVVDSFWHDEIAEMRMLSTLAAIAGAKSPSLPPTREFIAALVRERELQSAQSAASETAVRAAQAAESMFGGPA